MFSDVNALLVNFQHTENEDGVISFQALKMATKINDQTRLFLGDFSQFHGPGNYRVRQLP